jgi:ubiquinone/menaquinone biosynthesis C-methylase UbiE
MPRKRGIRFSGKALELGRKYMWRKEFVPLLYRYLDIHPGQKVVDVGCGTGFMTRLVAEALKGKGEVIGVDRNPQLLSYARKAATEAGLGSLVSFRQSDVTKLDLADDFADRVFCQAVLWAIPDPKKAMREMIRICKPGGLVGAIEGGFDSVLFYYPHSERLSELSNKQVRAGATGYRKLYGLDRGIGHKLPSLLWELGLERVRLDSYAYTWLQRDDRIPLPHKLQMYRSELKGLRHPSERYMESLMAGGMTSEEIDEHDRLYMEYVKKVIKNPGFSNQDTSVNAGIFFIATGIKK